MQVIYAKNSDKNNGNNNNNDDDDENYIYNRFKAQRYELYEYTYRG